MGLVIDTSALVSWERRTDQHWPSSLGEREQVVLPAIVYAELLAGVQLADSAERAASRQAKIDALASRVPVVEFGPDTARHWAALFADLHRRGRLIADHPHSL